MDLMGEAGVEGASVLGIGEGELTTGERSGDGDVFFDCSAAGTLVRFLVGGSCIVPLLRREISQ